MRKFNVSVNGKSYSVEVEEVGGAPSAAPVVASAPVAAAPKAAAPAGGVAVKAPMPGVVRKYAVAEGASVKKGQAVVVIEAMKMENDIVAPADGTVTFVAKIGDKVETDAVLAYVK